MNLALNGALTIGTLDGANIEIKDEVGIDNIFIFGLTADEVIKAKQNNYNPWNFYQNNLELQKVLNMLRDGYFSKNEPWRFNQIFESLINHGDNFMILADYAEYIACQDKVDELYCRPNDWVDKTIINIANMGKFSSDRTILDYAQDIWKVQPIKK
jgi:starch phosphorylase